MKYPLKATLLGVLAYFVALLATAPAAMVEHLLPKSVVLNELSGSLWQGQAGKAQLDKLDLGPVSWRLRPVDVFKGRLAFALDFMPPHMSGQGVVAATIPGLVANDVKLAWDADGFTPYLQGFGELDGRFSLNLSKLALSDKGVRSAEGVLSWDRAKVRYPRILRLGDLNAKLMDAEGSTVAVLKNEGGDLDLSGTVSLDANGKYQIRLTYKPTRRTKNEVRNAISQLGTAAEDGSVTIERSGIL